MKHAVILAHPNPKSFGAAIARACVETLTEGGETVVLRDLYAMGFDPCLKAHEIPVDAEVRFGADVVAERDLLADVQSFIFVYPFWFNAPPAILKGYVDRVFGMGFGFEAAVGGTEPALAGRSLMSVSTSGAPDQWVASTGALTTLMSGFDAHLASVCGLKVLDHVHFGGIAPNMTEESAADILAQARAAVRKRLLGQRAVA